MLNSLNRKILLILAGTMMIFTIVNMMLNTAATGTYLREVHQKLYKDFAKALAAQYYASEGPVLKKGRIARLFKDTLDANSNVAIYLLDRKGRIVCTSEKFSTIEREKVSIQPVMEFLSSDPMFPIMGENPQSADSDNIFSVAPINHAGSTLGYIYVMLDVGEDRMISMLENSSSQTQVALTTLAAFGMIFVIGASLMTSSTRKVRQLEQQISAFEESRFKQPELIANPGSSGGDELDRMRTTTRSMAEKITNQLAALERSHKFGIDLISNLSHDLRTPLANILGYVENVQRKPDISRQEREKMLGVALTNVSKLNGLLDELSSLISIETSLPLSSRELVEIHICLQLAVDSLPAADQRKIQLNFSDKKYSLRAEPNTLRQALKSILANGVNNLRAERLVVSTAVDDQRGTLTLTFHDSERTVDEENLRNYFSRYYRETGNPGKNESGIETALAKRILGAHGAIVEVSSSPGDGTILTVRLNGGDQPSAEQNN